MMGLDPEPLSRSTAVTIHEQLATRLRDMATQLAPGQQLPTEQELVKRFRVSRSTVRRAVQQLVDEGLLVRRQGKGTFLAAGRFVHPLDQLRPFISIFTAAGKHPEGTMLAYEWIAEPELLPEPLSSGGEGALLVRRLYSLEGIPQALGEIFVPGAFGRRISRSEIEEHPIYQVLQQRLGVTPHHAEIVLRSQGASAEQAERLRLAPGAPLLRMQRATYDSKRHVVECARYYLPSESFELRLTVHGQEPEALSYSFPRSGAHLVLIANEDEEHPPSDQVPGPPESR